MINKNFLLVIIGLLIGSTVAFGETFYLKDGSVEEGEITRIEDRRVTIMSSTGVRTYNVMEFDEDTQNKHFSALFNSPEQVKKEDLANNDVLDGKNAEHEPPTFLNISWPLLDYIHFYSLFPRLLFGLLLCFFGLRFYRQLMSTSGVVFGLGLGWLIAVPLLNMDNHLFSGLIMLGGAALLGFLFLTYVYLITILYGALFGLLATVFIINAVSMIGMENPTLNLALLLILPITGAILAFTHFRIMLIAATASMGSTLIVDSLYVIGTAISKGVFFDSPESVIPMVQTLKEDPMISANLQIAFFVVFIVGVIFQFLKTPSEHHQNNLPTKNACEPRVLDP